MSGGEQASDLPELHFTQSPGASVVLGIAHFAINAPGEFGAKDLQQDFSLDNSRLLYYMHRLIDNDLIQHPAPDKFKANMTTLPPVLKRQNDLILQRLVSYLDLPIEQLTAPALRGFAASGPYQVNRGNALQQLCEQSGLWPHTVVYRSLCGYAAIHGVPTRTLFLRNIGEHSRE